MLLILALFSMSAGSFACSNAHCRDPVLRDQLIEVDFLPDKDQLVTLCPNIIKSLGCEKDYMECFGKSIDELATSSDKSEAFVAQTILGMIDLVRDVCNEDSSFHSDYIASVDCYRDNVDGATGNCREEIAEPLWKFFHQLYTVGFDQGDRIYHEFRCLEKPYELACIVEHLGAACGPAAMETAREAVIRIKGMSFDNSCGFVKNATDLKTKFFDFLELDELQRISYQEIFDTFKRRR